MKISLDKILKDLDGVEMKENGKKLTLGRVLSASLVAPAGDKLTPIEVSDRFGLAMDMRAKKSMILEPEQVILCKEVVCKTYAPLISGQVCQLLIHS